MNQTLVYRLTWLVSGLGLLILSLLFAACGEPTATPTPTPQVATTLLSEVGPLCRNVQKAQTASETPSLKPLLFLNGGTEGEKWIEFFSKYYEIPAQYAQLQARTPAEVKGVACVVEKYVEVGKYFDLADTHTTGAASGTASTVQKGFRIDFQLRLVTYPEGKLIFIHDFKGADPPFYAKDSYDQYGERPDEALFNWLQTQIR